MIDEINKSDKNKQNGQIYRLISRAGTSTKSSSIERVRVPKIVFERVSSEYLKIISSTRATRVCSSSTQVPLEYFVSSIKLS